MIKLTIAIVILFQFIVLQTAFSQKIYGKIIDEDNLPIALASIHSVKTGRGTTSNEEGVFSIIFKETDKAFIISAIGFESKRVQLTDSLTTISLERKTKDLSEVYVVPDSTLRNIIKAAYNAIPINYSIKPFSLDGYYSESLFSSKDTLLYLAESTIRLFHEGYSKPFENGRVEILKSRAIKNPEKNKTDNTYYFGGAFVATARDPVKYGGYFLDPKYFNKGYSYELEGIESINESEVFVIKFKSKDKKYEVSGRLWIDKKTKAYWLIETNLTKNDDKLDLSKIERKTSNRKIKYRKLGDKWFLESVLVNGTNYNKIRKSNLKYQIAFYTTDIDTLEKKTINREAELDYKDILSETQINTDKSFFENSETYEKETAVQNQIDQFGTAEKPEKNNEFKLGLLKTRLRLRGSINIGYASQSGIFTNQNVQAFGMTFDKNELTKSYSFTPLFKTEIAYDLKSNREIYLGQSLGIFRGKKNSYTTMSLGLRQHFDISTKKTNQYVFVNAAIGLIHQENFLRKMESSADFGTTFNPRSDWVNLSTVSRTNLWSVGVGYGIRKRRTLYFVQGNYSQMINQSHRFNVTETKRLFNRSVNFSNEGISNLRSEIPKFTFEVGWKTNF